MPTHKQPPTSGGRRPGRPRRTLEQQAAAKERRIPLSRQGRLKFRPGAPHALDVQFREARNYRYLLTEKVGQLQAILASLDSQEDPSAALSAHEAALTAFLQTTYADHKHRDHILATFLTIRRARLLAKLEAAGAALEMAATLLAPDDTLLQEVRAAVAYQRQAATRQRPPTQPDQMEQSQTAILLRITGPDEATVRAQLDAIRTEQERQEAEDPTTRIDSRHIYGDTQSARHQLDTFGEQVKLWRAALSPAIGWFETFYVEKVRLTREARRYLLQGREPPEDMSVWEGVIYGPYLKYRWQEETGGPAYTIQMGLLSEGSLQDDGEEESSSDSWPSL